MRTRREVILVGGTAATVLSGCLQETPEDENGEAGEGQEQDRQDGNETGTNGEGEGTTEDEEEEGENGEDEQEDEPETEPASFEVSSVESPDSVEIGRSFRWSLTVRNDGGEDGVFETAVTRNRPGETPKDHTDVSFEVPAGEEVNRGFSSSHGFIGEYVYTVEKTGDSFEVTATERSLSIGETYLNTDGVRITVGERRSIGPTVELTQSYSYEREGQKRIERAGQEGRFAVLRITAQKRTREPKDLPRPDEFVMVVNGEEAYESTERLADDAYTGGRSRVSEEGIVMFEISEDFDRTDRYEIYWTRAYPEGTVEVVWSTLDDEGG